MTFLHDRDARLMQCQPLIDVPNHAFPAQGGQAENHSQHRTLERWGWAGMPARASRRGHGDFTFLESDSWTPPQRWCTYSLSSLPIPIQSHISSYFCQLSSAIYCESTPSWLQYRSYPLCSALCLRLLPKPSQFRVSPPHLTIPTSCHHTQRQSKAKAIPRYPQHGVSRSRTQLLVTSRRLMVSVLLYEHPHRIFHEYLLNPVTGH